MSNNVILTDNNGDQILPITTGENVFFDEEKTILQKINEILGGFASVYSSTSTYAVGDYVLYEDELYKCTTAITTAEEFDSNKWIKTNCGTEFESLNSNLPQIASGTVTTDNLGQFNLSNFNLPSGTKALEIYATSTSYNIRRYGSWLYRAYGTDGNMVVNTEIEVVVIYSVIV